MPNLLFLTDRPFAHRGLHDRSGRPENSLAAFAAAIDAGQGMECDVRLSADGIAMVFHDADLQRLTGTPGRTMDCTAAQLESLRLCGTDQPVPRLSALLALVDGKAPLLIEIKSPEEQSIYPLCEAVAHDLDGYDGPVAIMSFNPLIVRWFAAHAPHVARGLVVTEMNDRGMVGDWRRRIALRVTRPHFLAYDIRDMPAPITIAQRRKGMPVLSWTVRTDEQRAIARVHIDQIIHELPALGGVGPAAA